MLTEAPVSNTRRGFGMWILGHVGLGLAALSWWLFGTSFPTGLLFFAGGALVWLGAYFLWHGRFESVPGHDRGVQWSLRLLIMGTVAILGMILSLSTTVAQTLRPSDLAAAVYLLPLLITADAIGVLAATWGPARTPGRLALLILVGVAGLGAAFMTLHGLSVVDDIVLWLGPTVTLEETARQAVATFLAQTAAWWIGYATATRALVAYILWDTSGQVIERDTEDWHAGQTLRPAASQA